jgi:hypothetical protein
MSKQPESDLLLLILLGKTWLTWSYISALNLRNKAVEWKMACDEGWTSNFNKLSYINPRTIWELDPNVRATHDLSTKKPTLTVQVAVSRFGSAQKTECRLPKELYLDSFTSDSKMQISRAPLAIWYDDFYQRFYRASQIPENCQLRHYLAVLSASFRICIR